MRPICHPTTRLRYETQKNQHDDNAFVTAMPCSFQVRTHTPAVRPLQLTNLQSDGRHATQQQLHSQAEAASFNGTDDAITKQTQSIILHPPRLDATHGCTFYTTCYATFLHLALKKLRSTDCTSHITLENPHSTVYTLHFSLHTHTHTTHNTLHFTLPSLRISHLTPCPQPTIYTPH